MNNLIKSLKTEFIKKKRSGIFTLSFIIGVFLPITFFIISFFYDNEKQEVKIPVNVYFDYLKIVLIPFVSFFFPILIIIITSKIAQIDHKNRGWHLMETQPTTKFSIFFSKFILLLAANLIAIGSFLISIILLAWIKTLIKETPNAIFILPAIDFLKVGIKMFLISLCITAFQYTLAVIIKGFIWPILIGFLSMLLPLMLVTYKNQLFWYPYLLLTNISTNPKGSDFGYWFTYADILSILLTILFLFIGFNWYKFKTFFKAFLYSNVNVLKFIGVLLVIGLLITFTIKPKHQKNYGKTIISGTIDSDKEIKKVYVIDYLIKDTIVSIDVVDNKFHNEITKDIIFDKYEISFDHYDKGFLAFGSKDSLNIAYQLYGKQSKMVVNGTRIPENKRGEKRRRRWSYIGYSLENNQRIDDANFYMKEIYDNWKKDLFKIKGVRTVDNLVPRNDFLRVRNIEVTLQYISYWNMFKKLRKSLYPDKDYILTDGIIELENSVSKTDDSLLTIPKYFDFIMEGLIKDDTRNVSEDTKHFDAIRKLEKGKFKDKLMFTQLTKGVEEAKNVNERDSLFNLCIKSIETESYIKLLKNKCFNLNRLSIGNKAPNFIVFDKNNNEYQLENFKGKYLLIDVWASWCGPCIHESPYFEKKALEYKNKNIKFISISIDRKKQDWLLATENKGNTTPQFHLTNIIKFGKKYNFSSIPRFILISPDGKIIDANFERPSSKNFNTLLDMYLKEYSNQLN